MVMRINILDVINEEIPTYEYQADTELFDSEEFDDDANDILDSEIDE
jgi:hypothetical protein